MESTGRLVVLCLGLCFVSYVNAVEIYGSGLFNFNENLTKKLSKLKSNQKEIEGTLKRGNLMSLEKLLYSRELEVVLRNIKDIEQTSRVAYKDYIRMQALHEGKYEIEIANLKAQLEKAKKQAINEDVQRYQKELKNVENDREEIKKVYEKHVQLNRDLEAKMKQEQARLEQEKAELAEVLSSVKSRHARSLAMMSAASNEAYKPIRIPQVETINGLQKDIQKFIVNKDKQKRLNGLRLTKTKLVSLLPELNEKSRFHEGTSRSDMESALSEMELNTAQLRAEQNNKRKALIEKLKKEDVSDNDLASLQKLNEELEATDNFSQEIIRRSAYLNALINVHNLIKECSDAIKDSESGVLSKLLAFAFK